MLAEMIMYIALFAALFSGSFSAIFQSIDAIHYLEQKEEVIDARTFLAARLDIWLQNSNSWLILTDDKLQFTVGDNFANNAAKNNPYILFLDNGALKIKCADCADGFEQPLSEAGPTGASSAISIETFSPQIINTSTNQIKILNISLEINKNNYIFSYYVEK
jgi:hypothetical protein